MKNLFHKKPILYVVCGPTATGKTAFALELARKHDGEIVSADSRQVYRGLDIGTAKITVPEMQGIPHHMIDVADPRQTYSVAEYKRDAEKIIADIHARGKVPILVGGTGQYIDAVIWGHDFPPVLADKQLRSDLEKLSLLELQATLKKLDKERYLNIDIQNPVRLVRAIEIATKIGKVPKLKKRASPYKLEIIYMDKPDLELRERIYTRNVDRLEHGLIEEVAQLNAQGLTWERMRALGLEYRYVSQFLNGVIPSKEALLEVLDLKIRQYAKRQRTWFKRYKDI